MVINSVSVSKPRAPRLPALLREVATVASPPGVAAQARRAAAAAPPPARSATGAPLLKVETRGGVGGRRRDRPGRAAAAAPKGSRATQARPRCKRPPALHSKPTPVPRPRDKDEVATETRRGPRQRRSRPAPQTSVPATGAQPAPIPAGAPAGPTAARVAAHYLAITCTSRAPRDRLTRRAALERAAALDTRTAASAAGSVFTGAGRATAGAGTAFTGTGSAFAGAGRIFTGARRSFTGARRKFTGARRTFPGTSSTFAVAGSAFTGAGSAFAWKGVVPAAAATSARLAALAAPGGDAAGAARPAGAALPAHQRVLPAALAGHGLGRVHAGGGAGGRACFPARRRGARHGRRKPTLDQSGGLFRGQRDSVRAQRVPRGVPIGHNAASIRRGSQILSTHPAVRAAQRHGARFLPAAAAQGAGAQASRGGRLGARQLQRGGERARRQAAACGTTRGAGDDGAGRGRV